MTRRIRCVCRGAVQGVGFRPAVHLLASSLGLAGWVRNDPEGAVVEVEGTEGSVESFRRRLPAELPPLARLDGLDVMDVPPRGEPGFEVLVSAEGIRRTALVPPDAASEGSHPPQKILRRSLSLSLPKGCAPQAGLDRCTNPLPAAPQESHV